MPQRKPRQADQVDLDVPGANAADAREPSPPVQDGELPADSAVMGDVATVNHQAVIVPQSWDAMSANAVALTSYPRTREYAGVISRALFGESKTLQSVVNTVLSVEHAILGEREYVDEHGELSRGLCMVLVDDKGVVYRTWSMTAIASFQAAACLCGPPRWMPALKLRVVGRPVQPVGTVLALVIEG